MAQKPDLDHRSQHLLSCPICEAADVRVTLTRELTDNGPYWVCPRKHRFAEEAIVKVMP